MLGYIHELESRIADLPCETEARLHPKEIAKMLGESTRQHFLRSGVLDTVQALQATSMAMTAAQKVRFALLPGPVLRFVRSEGMAHAFCELSFELSHIPGRSSVRAFNGFGVNLAWRWRQ